jgi:hypothetical protein
VEHPPLAALTLHLEGELEGAERAAVAHHLSGCWLCRRELELLEKGVYAFVDYRREVLLPAAAPAEPDGLLRRLRQEAAQESRASWLQFAHLPRAAWVASGTALAAMLIAFWFSAAPTLTAAEFLRLASAAHSDGDAHPRAVIYQKVRIRRGGAVFQRATYRGAPGLRGDAAASGAPDEETLRALGLAGINWQDPLNVSDFAAWRDAQKGRRDQITQLADRVTLKTNVLADSPVAATSLTVSRADWHAVGRIVEFRDQPPVEVTEVAYELREIPPPEAPRAVSAAVAPRVEPPAEAKSARPEMNLDEDELRLREAFHRIGADRREAPEIRVTAAGIEFRLWAESEERRQEILHAAADIPHVAQAAPEPLSAPRTDDRASSSSVYSTEPPLRKALWEYLGGLNPANTYLARLSEPYDRVLTDASALARLAQRYSGPYWQNLRVELRARVDRIAADHVAVIRPQAQSYVTQISPLLQEMLRRGSLAETEVETPAASCGAWQDVAPAIPRDMRDLHTSFRRLFLEDQVESPVTLSAEGLLRQSARGRARLMADVNVLCQAQ